MAFTLTAGYTWTSGEVVTATKLQSAAVPTLADAQTYAFGLGSAATPSVTFSGDANTGVYSPGADQVSVSCGGSQIVAVSSSGLAVTGTVAASGAISVLGAGAGALNVNSSSAVAVAHTLGSYYNAGASFADLNISAAEVIFKVSGTERGRFSATGLAVTGALTSSTGFGCNGNAAQTKAVSGGTLAGVIAALVANGILSS